VTSVTAGFLLRRNTGIACVTRNTGFRQMETGSLLGGQSQMSKLESRAARAGLIFAACVMAFLLLATLAGSAAPTF
jgi:hypothetical protein